MHRRRIGVGALIEFVRSLVEWTTGLPYIGPFFWLFWFALLPIPLLVLPFAVAWVAGESAWAKLEQWLAGLRGRGEPPAVRSLSGGQDEYREYLNSPEWQAKRRLALEQAGWRCKVCNSTTRLQVHHRTYDRVGNEELCDLTVLCATCHQLFHDGGRMPVGADKQP